MTVFLCVMAIMALLGFAQFNMKRATVGLIVALQVCDVVMTLGLATLALWSYLS